MKINEIDKIVKDKLSPQRYAHSKRVAAMAKELAKVHGLPAKKVEKAALLHDVGYYFAGRSKKKGLKHAELGERYAKKIGIKSEKILQAIRWHTVGNVAMDDFAKVVFLADKLEPSRSFEGVRIIRKIAYYDIDLALFFVLESTKKYLLKKREKVHPDTVKLYIQLRRKLFGE